jgi:membrane-bound serine protease (ClpP class)
MHVAHAAITALAHLRPDAALFLMTFGLLLIYVELNRPGWILPGAIGLLLTLLSIASILRLNLRPPAALLVVAAMAVLTLNLLRPIHVFLAAIASLALIAGFAYLIPGPANSRVHPSTAILCGLILGAGTSVLTSIARRARTNKRVRLA